MIPKEWTIYKIEDIARTTSGGTPSRKMKKYYNGHIPWIKSGELNDNYIYETEEKISENALKNSSAKLFPSETLLIAMYGATVGKTSMLKVAAATNQAVCAVFPKSDLADYNYLQYYFIYSRPLLLRQRYGGAQPNISQTTIRNFEVTLPPLPEQRNIAYILSKIQSAIEMQEKIIKTTTELKKALMQKLFTEGLHNEPQKETEIGLVPESWEVCKLSDVAEITMGQSPKGETYNTNKEGYPLLNGPAEFGEKYPIVVQWTTRPTKKSRMGDILFCVRGNTTGRINISDDSYCIGRGLAAISNIHKLSDIDFVYYLLQYNKANIYRIAIAGGSTFPNISGNQLNSYFVAMPKLEEQKQISSFLKTIDNKIELSQKKEQLYLSLFKSMLCQLMTGQIRVKDMSFN